jgi:hypothetical protein
MGEYADDMYRREVQSKFGFDPGSMYVTCSREVGIAPKLAPKRVACEACGKLVKFGGLNDHTRDVHGGSDAAPAQR